MKVLLLGLTIRTSAVPNNIAGTSPKRVNPKPMHTTTAGDSPLHTTTSSSLDIALRDPSLLRGCTAGTLLNDCSSVFSSNILGKDEVSIMHKNTAQVDKLDDFVSHHGAHCWSGHYTCVARLADTNRWVSYDDRLSLIHI